MRTKLVVITAVVLAAFCCGAEELTIRTVGGPTPLVTFAAREVQRYVYLRTGQHNGRLEFPPATS